MTSAQNPITRRFTTISKNIFMGAMAAELQRDDAHSLLEPHRVTKLHKVLARIRALDARIREVLQAKREFVFMPRAEAATDRDVVGEIEAGGKPLAIGLIDRRHECCAHAAFDKPRRTPCAWP